MVCSGFACAIGKTKLANTTHLIGRNSNVLGLPAISVARANGASV